MPLGLNKQRLQNVKDEIVYELKERGLTYDELAHIFNMTKQGCHKAYKRYIEKSLTKG